MGTGPFVLKEWRRSSRIVLERLDSRYVVTERETFYASDILLTPYSAENTIDVCWPLSKLVCRIDRSMVELR